MLKYRKEVRNRTKGESQVRWEGEIIILNQVKFSIGELRTIVYRLVETVRKRLRVDLMMLGDKEEGEERMPKLDLSSIKDVLGEIAEGFNFLSLLENE